MLSQGNDEIRQYNQINTIVHSTFDILRKIDINVEIWNQIIRYLDTISIGVQSGKITDEHTRLINELYAEKKLALLDASAKYSELVLSLLSIHTTIKTSQEEFPFDKALIFCEKVVIFYLVNHAEENRITYSCEKLNQSVEKFYKAYKKKEKALTTAGFKEIVEKFDFQFCIDEQKKPRIEKIQSDLQKCIENKINKEEIISLFNQIHDEYNNYFTYIKNSQPDKSLEEKNILAVQFLLVRFGEFFSGYSKKLSFVQYESIFKKMIEILNLLADKGMELDSCYFNVVNKMNSASSGYFYKNQVNSEEEVNKSRDLFSAFLNVLKRLKFSQKYLRKVADIEKFFF